jgi:hypothetical protein
MKQTPNRLSTFFLPALLWAMPAHAQGVWLKGDLHLHSRHSQDSTNNSVAKIIGFAQKEGFDFLGITDHDNHVDGDTEHHTWADPEWKSDRLVLLYAAEWTTERGHVNVFSAHPYDQALLRRMSDARDGQLIGLRKVIGVHMSANHPTNKDHYGFSFDMVDSMEVWNSANWPKNLPTLTVWDDMLKSGRMIAGRGGSDSHHGWPDTPDQRSAKSGERLANYVGTPTTWVYAKSRDRQGVVDALTHGHASISANPKDPRVELTADLDGDGRDDGMMGDNLRATGKPVRFRIHLAQCPIDWAQYQVRVIRDGEVFMTLPVDAAKGEAVFTDTPPTGRRSYYRLEVEGPQADYPAVPMAAGLSGTMVALSNPLYFNFDPAF